MPHKDGQGSEAAADAKSGRTPYNIDFIDVNIYGRGECNTLDAALRAGAKFTGR